MRKWVIGLFSLTSLFPISVAAEEQAPPETIRLSLSDCVALATARNIGVLQRALDNRKQELSLFASERQWIPDFSATWSPDLQDGDNSASMSVSVPASPFGTTVSVSASHDWTFLDATSVASVSITQPLLEGSNRYDNILGLYSNRISAARNRNSLEMALQDLIFDVHSSYLSAIKQELTIRVQKKALDRVLELHRATKEKERLGMVTVLDIAEVEDQLASRRLALKQVREAYQRSLDTLKRTLDMNVERPLVLEPVDIETDQYENEREKVELVADEDTRTVYRLFTRKGELGEGELRTRREVVFEPALVNRGVVLEKALANRLDLVNARLELARLRLEVEASRRTLLPDLDLSFNYSQSGTGATSRTSFPLDESSWSVSLSLSMPFSPLDDRVDLNKALLDYERQRMEVRDKEEEVRKDVRDLMRDLDTSAYAVYSYGLQLRSAHIGLESARITYEMGHTGFFRVLDAEDRLLDAEKNFISAYLDYNLLLQELAVVTGRSTGLLAALVQYGRKVEQKLLENVRVLPAPPAEVVRMIRSREQAHEEPFLIESLERAGPAREIAPAAPLPGDVPAAMPEAPSRPGGGASPESTAEPVGEPDGPQG